MLTLFCYLEGREVSLLWKLGFLEICDAILQFYLIKMKEQRAFNNGTYFAKRHILLTITGISSYVHILLSGNGEIKLKNEKEWDTGRNQNWLIHLEMQYNTSCSPQKLVP